MLITKNSRLLQTIAFYNFVYFVYRQFISFVTKMEVVARITSSRLVFTSLLRIWDRIDLVITVNTSSRSQWNAALWPTKIKVKILQHNGCEQFF